MVGSAADWVARAAEPEGLAGWVGSVQAAESTGRAVLAVFELEAARAAELEAERQGAARVCTERRATRRSVSRSGTCQR